jgi:hypothetical protein
VLAERVFVIFSLRKPVKIVIDHFIIQVYTAGGISKMIRVNLIWKEQLHQKKHKDKK